MAPAGENVPEAGLYSSAPLLVSDGAVGIPNPGAFSPPTISTRPSFNNVPVFSQPCGSRVCPIALNWPEIGSYNSPAEGAFDPPTTSTRPLFKRVADKPTPCEVCICPVGE